MSVTAQATPSPAPAPEDPIDVGARIRDARESRGMTQKQLAQALYDLGYRAHGPAPIPTPIISLIEHGRRPVPRLMRRFMELALDITIQPRPPMRRLG